MTTARSHQQWRDELGAYVLGLLSDRDADAVRRHLDRCRDCRGEHADLAPLADALRGMDGNGLAGPPAPSPDLGERIVAHVAAERARERRTRRLRRVAAAATLVVALVAVVLITRPGPPPESPRESVALSEVATGVEAEADLIAHPWGTEIILVASGLEDGGVYAAAFERAGGAVVPAGTFLGVGDAPLTCRLNAALLRQDVTGFSVTDAAGHVVVSVDLPAT